MKNHIKQMALGFLAGIPFLALAFIIIAGFNHLL